VDEEAIAHQTRLFVFIEAQIEELAQVSPTLRRAPKAEAEWSAPAQGLPSWAVP
jgi:hypothetical protein